MPKSNRWHRKSSLAFKANVHFPLSTTEHPAALPGRLRPQRMAALSAKQTSPRSAAMVRNRAFPEDSQISVSGRVWPSCSRVRFATPARSLCVLPRRFHTSNTNAESHPQVACSLLLLLGIFGCGRAIWTLFQETHPCHRLPVMAVRRYRP
jgi:hypothetical protein